MENKTKYGSVFNVITSYSIHYTKLYDLSENYFSEGINTFTQYPEVWCVGGTVNNVFINDTGRVIAAAMATTFGMGLGNFRTMKNSGFVDTIGTPIYPKKVFV